MPTTQIKGLGEANYPNSLWVSMIGKVDCWITLGTYPSIQNLTVAFTIPWFSKDLLIHPFDNFVCVGSCAVVVCVKVEKLISLVITR
jgi:hypothetical protein